MSIHKDNATGKWRVVYRYTDWTGETHQSSKRGFPTKREAQMWERELLLKKEAKLDMTFESFYEIYVEDMQNRIRDNTWGTKTNIARTKILPYFGKRKIGEIEPRDIIAWQNELLAIGEQDRRIIMEKHIMGENGISYTLGEDGLYYPDLYLPEETEYPIGKYGMLRKSYLKEHRKGLYLELVLSGKLNEHLHQVDEECNQMMYRLMEQMKEKQGVTEELKTQNQMAWVGRMNNIRACAEEIVVKEIVLTWSEK
nr:TnpV protein [uncultured Enterococcus sp.]